ncbi:MAG: hypothetical protein Q9220_000470 [cf. Caloplaca sp. 1 TL-2023]
MSWYCGGLLAVYWFCRVLFSLETPAESYEAPRSIHIMRLERALDDMEIERSAVSKKTARLESSRKQDHEAIAELRQTEQWCKDNYSKLWEDFEEMERTNHEMQAQLDHEHKKYKELEDDLKDSRQDTRILRTEHRCLRRKPSLSLPIFPVLPMTETTMTDCAPAVQRMAQGDEPRQVVASQTETLDEQGQALPTTKQMNVSASEIPEISLKATDSPRENDTKLEDDIAAMKILHHEALTDKAEVEEQKEEVKKDNKRLQEALNNLEVRMTDEATLSSKRNERLEEAMTKIDQLERENEQSHKANAVLQGEMKTLEDEHDVLRKTRTDLADARLMVGQLQEEAKELKDANTTLEEKNSIIISNEEGLNQTKEALCQEESKVTQLRSEIEHLHNNVAAADAKAMEVDLGAKRRIEDVEKNMHDLHNTCLISQKDNQSLMNELKNLKEYTSNAEIHANKCDRWGRELQGYLHEIWKTLRPEEEELRAWADLMDEVRTQSELCKTLKQNVANLTDEVRVGSESCTSLKQNVADLTNEVRARSESCTALEQNVADMTQQRDHWQHLKTGDGSASHLQDQLQSTEAKLQKALSDKKDLGKAYLESKNLASKQYDRIAGLRGELKTREDERDGSRASNDPLRKQLQTKNERVHELGQQLMDLESRKQASEKELQSLDAETKKLGRNIKELKAHKSKLLETCNNLKKKGADQGSAQGTEKRTYGSEIEEEEEERDDERHHSTKIVKVDG